MILDLSWTSARFLPQPKSQSRSYLLVIVQTNKYKYHKFTTFNPRTSVTNWDNKPAWRWNDNESSWRYVLHPQNYLSPSEHTEYTCSTRAKLINVLSTPVDDVQDAAHASFNHKSFICTGSLWGGLQGDHRLYLEIPDTVWLLYVLQLTCSNTVTYNTPSKMLHDTNSTHIAHDQSSSLQIFQHSKLFDTLNF